MNRGRKKQRKRKWRRKEIERLGEKRNGTLKKRRKDNTEGKKDGEKEELMEVKEKRKNLFRKTAQYFLDTLHI